MLAATKITRSKLPSIVQAAFDGDTELIEKYHVVNTCLADCVKDTVERIEQASQTYTLRCFAVAEGKEDAGFIVVGDDFLYSFGLNAKYRSKGNLQQFWALVTGVLPANFFSVMNFKNTRAVKFLERNKMKIIHQTQSDITLIYTPCR